jgi:hydroxyacylglutathione hydrolase
MREKMPHDTKMFCGHEYSVSNLEFCLKMDPKNVFIQAKLAELKALRGAGWFTVPTTISEEL